MFLERNARAPQHSLRNILQRIRIRAEIALHHQLALLLKLAPHGSEQVGHPNDWLVGIGVGGQINRVQRRAEDPAAGHFELRTQIREIHIFGQIFGTGKLSYPNLCASGFIGEWKFDYILQPAQEGFIEILRKFVASTTKPSYCSICCNK